MPKSIDVAPTCTRTLVLLLAFAELALFLGFGARPSAPSAPHPLRCERPASDTLNTPRFTTGDDDSCAAHAAPSFWSMGIAVVTDKVTVSGATAISMSHSYQFAYERYLRPRRCEKLDVLEIGLGCGMPYKDESGKEVPSYMQAGHSVPLWLAFLPRAKLNMFEYSEKCARDFFDNDPLKIGEPLHTRVKMFLGDQSKDADLLKAMATMGPQDIIIDDGGHSMMQQEVSLRVLFKFLKPGGIYILEDLQTSYSWMDPAWHDKPGDIGMVDYISKMISGLHWPEYAEKLDKKVYPGLTELLPLIKNIDCFREICVFQRWPEGEPNLDEFPVGDSDTLRFDQRTGSPL